MKKKRVLPSLGAALLTLCLCACGAEETRADAPQAQSAEAERVPAAAAGNENEEKSKMEKALRLRINDTEVTVDWEENEAVETLKDLVSAGALSVRMSGYGGFEQVGPLGTSLPGNDVQTTTQPGDVVLYAGDQIVIFYGSNTWAYTRLGRISNLSAEELTDLLANGGVVITLSMEQREET